MRSETMTALLAGLFLAASPLAATATDLSPNAIAVVHPTEGKNVKGVVYFKNEGDSIMVSAHIEGLTPGEHGFHIHEAGDCSAPDGSSAGGHWNPGAAPHGAPGDAKRHAGDLGNLKAGPDGMARLEWKDSQLKLTGDQSIVGRAVVVHEKADDLKSQPTGDAGGRVACGVIGVQKLQ